MSATNHTTNYELPIFVGTDKPAWLVDWNGAMTAIDTAIHTAEGKADQAGTDIGGIESAITTINGTLTSINNAVSQLRVDTNANTGSINTITSLIGNGLPTTTDKTIIGAINEIVAYHNIDDPHTGTITSSYGTVSSTSDVRSLLNAVKSFGKIYGGFMLSGAMTIPTSGEVVLATISDLGLPTIAEAYSIYLGYAVARYSSNSSTVLFPIYFRFNTNGSVSVYTKDAGIGAEVNYIAVNLPPCMYMLQDLGD